jgi:hypothetical protein
MDEFFSRLMKVQTSTPPPQPMSIESMASNIAHVVETTPPLGDSSPSLPIFKLSVSPQFQIASDQPCQTDHPFPLKPHQHIHQIEHSP